jgi:chromosome segregation ATPase
MSGKKWGLILSAMVLVGITIFCAVNYYTLLDQNWILQKLVRSYERKITEMEEAKEAMEVQLTKEKDALDLQLKEAQAQLKLVTEELSAAKDKVTTLEKDNSDLLAKQKELQDKVDAIVKEKEVLEAKFNSLKELRQAIHDLKEKMYQERLAVRRELRAKQLIEGNRGYLTYQGVPTNRGKVRIEVIPVP